MPVKIYSSDGSGFGVIVIKADHESILKHVMIKNAGNTNVDEADELYKKFCQPKPKLPKAEK
jgi:hypothetical protein